MHYLYMYPSHLIHTRCADERNWYFLSNIENNRTDYNSLQACFNPPTWIRTRVIEIAKKIESIFQLWEVALLSDSTCRSCKYNIDEEWGWKKCIALDWNIFTIWNIWHGSIWGDDYGMNSVCPIYLKAESSKKMSTGTEAPISDIWKLLTSNAIKQNFLINPMQLQQEFNVADDTLRVHIDHNWNGTMSVSFRDLSAVKNHLHSLYFSWEKNPGKGYFYFTDLIIWDKKTRFIDTLNPYTHA